MATRTTPTAAATSPSYIGPFITVTALFFIFGFITNLNMALVPHLRSIFNLPYAWAMLAESAFFLAYFVFSSPTSKLIEIDRLQEDDGGFAVHPGGGLPAVCAGGQDGELFAVPDCGVRCGRGRDGAADGGQSVCCDPWTGKQRSGPAEPGAGVQLDRRHASLRWLRAPYYP